MMLEIRKVESKSDMNSFLKLPWKIYKGDKCWVPPLLKDLRESLDPASNVALKKIEHSMYLAFGDGKPVGRIYVGLDKNLNDKKKMKMAFFSMFECVNDYQVAELLFNTAFEWAKEKGSEFMCGPVAITGTDGDENKGLLVDCFDRPPVIMNSYNPPYYKDFMEKYGFVKDYDVYAYHLDKDVMFKKNPTKIIEYAKKRYDFRVDTIDLNNLEREIRDLKHVMDLAMPDEWPDLVPPTLEEVRDLAKKLVGLADPALVPIARHGDEAIGFAIALPDYNQVLIHLNGRITPLAAIKFLWYKRKIKGVRVFAMFVVPEYRNKGVSFAIYHKAFSNGIEKGYTWGEGSTIGETNYRMRADIEGTGATHYKTYRIYRKNISN